MTTTPTSGAEALASRLRTVCTSARSKSYQLADLSPPMQQAADALASTPAQQVDDVVANLTEYAMYIAHERELQVTGHKHDSEGALCRFQSAVIRAIATAQPAAPPSGKTYEVLIHDLEVIASTTLHATVEGSRRSYERDAVRQAIEVVRASHGQAPAAPKGDIDE